MPSRGAPALHRLGSILGGHAWTIGADLAARVRPTPPPPDEPWEIAIADRRLGSIRLAGRVREASPDTLVVVVHGLGGNSDSPYVHRAAIAVHRRGWSCLRIDLRGADGRGEDLYHAALSADISAAIAACPRFTRVFVLGYSLGGHLALRHAVDGCEGRVAATVAVCAPLDLAATAAAIDRRRAWVYRVHVLRGLKRAHAEVAARGRSDAAVDAVRGVRTIREWDAAVVVPRHGFGSVDRYYREASVGPRLGGLTMPAAWFGARFDPMVPTSTVVPSLTAAGSRLHVRWFDRGGHVGFPADTADGRSVEDAAMDFFAASS